ncbi:hypothetical protein ACWF62_17645 [Rhodococcus sp. NPDC054953]
MTEPRTVIVHCPDPECTWSAPSFPSERARDLRVGEHLYDCHPHEEDDE